jgi:hypothetical protein
MFKLFVGGYIVLLLTTAACEASLVTEVSGRAQSFSSGGFQIIAICSASGASTAACSDTASNGSVDLAATADYGRLTANVSGTVDAPPNQLNFGGQASFTDMLTISAAGVPAGYVQYRLALSGRAFSSDAGITASVEHDGSVAAFYSPYGGGGASGPIDLDLLTPLVPFTSGKPFAFGMTAQANTYLQPTFSAQRATDEVLFALTGVSVYDANQQLLASGYRIYSPSSTYDGLVSQVPEPATLALVLAGMAGLIVRRSRFTARPN